MPVKSKAQFRLMKAVESGSIKIPDLSKKEAKEMTKDNVGNKSYSKLPEFKKIRKMMKRDKNNYV